MVLLDFGLMVEVPEALRIEYCRLWCSFLLNDQAAARSAATALAGMPNLVSV